MKRSLALFAIALNLSCASLPPFPEVEQAGYSYKFKKFRACDTETGKCRNIRLDDPSMEGAQCLSGPDYKKSEQWVTTVKQIAESRCH